MENPFSLLPLEYEKYYGPKQILKTALQTIGGPVPTAVNITGLNGMGKSALLKHLALQPVLKGYSNDFSEPYRSRSYLLFPIYVGFGDCPAQPVQYLYQRYVDAYFAYYEFLQSIENVEFDKDDLSKPILLKQTDMNYLQAIYNEITSLSKFRIRPIFLLDDINLSLPQFGDELESIRPWRTYASIIICSEMPITDIDPRASAVFGIFNYHTINGLDETEAKAFLQPHGGKAKSILFPEADIAYLFEQVGRHPSLLLLGGKHLWDIRKMFGLLETEIPLDDDKKQLLKSHLETDCMSRFVKYWNSLIEEKKEILSRLTKGERIFPSSPYLSPLVREGLVVFENDEPRIFSKLFEEYVRKQQDIPHVVTEDKIRLAGYENVLFQYMRDHPTRVCSYDEIWDAVWGSEVSPESVSDAQKRRQIQVTVARVNKKLREGSDLEIAGKRGIGYQLVRRTMS